MTLPIALAGSDLIGQARTGTGKTLGFGVPLLQRIAAARRTGAPARRRRWSSCRPASCASRSPATCRPPARSLGVRVTAIYGGRAYEPQVEALRKGVDVVVGTPGRLLDLASRAPRPRRRSRVLVLDEADEMLDLGFLPDVERILARVPDERQTMLFSRDHAGPDRRAGPAVHAPADAHPGRGATTSAAGRRSTQQFVYRAHAMDKVEMLARILQARGRGLTMVFCRTKRTAQKVADDLADRGFAAAAVHGDLGQGAREQALRAFRSGKVDVLVATDVAARGIDVEDVTHVINYQCPEDEKAYLHRIGRTGRAGASGRRGHVRRLGRHAPLEADQRGARPAVPRAGGDLLHLRAPVRRPGHPDRRDRAAAAGAADPGRAGRRGGRGPRRDRRARRLRGGGPGRGPLAGRRPGRRSGSGLAPDEETAESRPRRSRARRRTRAGQPVDGVGGRGRVRRRRRGRDRGRAGRRGRDRGGRPGRGRVPAVEADLAGAESGPGSGAGEGQRRRRRRRGGRGRGAKPEATDESVAESA